MIELPIDFPHQCPENYSYKVDQFKNNVLAIWLYHHKEYIYSSKPVYSIWGFYNTKKKEYLVPINSKKCGSKIDISNTTPYTAMQLNLNPLEMAFR